MNSFEAEKKYCTLRLVQINNTVKMALFYILRTVCLYNNTFKKIPFTVIRVTNDVYF